ncbi:hypothetical protein BH10BAC5_BH10BAC5_02900 [soil metagenome]
MKIRKLFFIIIFISGASGLFAQNDGAANTGLAFLKNGVGARQIAMGETSSLNEDAASVYYNPARLLFGPKNNVTIMHSSSIQDVSNDFIASKIAYEKFALGFGLIYTSINNIEVRTAPGAAIESFNAKDLSIGVSLAYRLSKKITIGATSKLLYEKIYVDEASGLAFDLGTNITFGKLDISFAVANLGTITALKNSETVLPSSIRFGTGYRNQKGNISYMIGLDGYKVLDGGTFHINTGAEVGFKEIVFLRAGYQTSYENKGLSTGIGVKYKSINIDYAFVPYKNEFGNSNTFSLSLVF